MPLNSKSKIGLLAVFAAITGWALTAGYYQVFSLFPWYDDEGYMMLTVKQFLDGGILYDQIYTQYGPAYYLYRWIFFNLSGLPVTHDATRLTTLVIWTLTAMLCGIFTFRLTRSTIFSAVSYVLTFLILFRTTCEPGHPQELCGLLIVSILLLLTDGESERRAYFRLAVFAALLAALCLTKINLGIFVGLGSAVALLAFSKENRWQRGALFALTALAALLPFILFRKYFAVGWLKLCTLIAVMIISAVVNGSLTRDKPEITAKHYITMSAAFGAAALLIIFFVLSKGTTLNALLDGVLLQHLKFSDDFYQSAPIQRLAVYYGFFVLAAAIALAYLRRKFVSAGAIALNLLKIGFGLFVVLCSLWSYATYVNTFLILSFATPWLWLLTADSSADEIASRNKLAKTALIFIAVLLPLQIFPIAGTQMAYGSFLMCVVGVICLADGCGWLRHYLSPKFNIFYRRIGAATVAAVLLVMLGGQFLYNTYTVYYRQFPLSFDGATRIRLPEKDAALYNFLVENLKSKCDNFISMPGTFSLNFWTRIESPTTLNATAWMSLLNESQQREVLEKYKKFPRLCAVYQPLYTRNGARNRNLAELPLSAYVLNDLKVKGIVNDYRFMTAKETSDDLIYAAKIVPNRQNSIDFTLPKDFQINIARLQLFDAARQRIIADSLNNSTEVSDGEGKPAVLPLKTDSDAATEKSYGIRFTELNAADLPERSNLILRLFDDTGNLKASLPFVENP